MIASCTNPSQHIQIKADKQEIAGLWKEYQNAIADSNGAAVVEMVDSFTISYYDHALYQAKTADSTQVEKKPLFDKYFILLIRHTLSGEQILNYSGRDVLEYFVDCGFFNYTNARLGSINVVNNEATTNLVNKEGKLLISLHYLRENGQWKIAFGVFYEEQGDKSLRYILSQTDMTEREAILYILENLNGKIPDTTIWYPAIPPAITSS